MKHINKIQFVAPTKAPKIEFDYNVCAWYVRFSNAKVAKTICDESSQGMIATIDIGQRNEVIGIELLGVKEFSLSMVKQMNRIDTSHVDFDRAKFVRAENREPVDA